MKTGKLGFVVVLVLALTGAGCPTPGDGTRYFLVAERDVVHGDSYVLPLSAPEDIAHAEALIDDPDTAGAPIVLAKIVQGSSEGDYVNRNLSDAGEAWSWRVTEFLGFSDVTAEIYDGWPAYVEENYDDFVGTTQGQVGFWSYTIVREVARCEMAADCIYR